MKKILITERLDQDALNHFKKNAEFIFDILEDTPDNEIIKEKLKDYNALIVRSKTKVDRDLLSAGKSLEVIGRAGVGTDNIDVEFAEKKGILVINAPEESLDSVADLAMGLIIGTCRDLKTAIWRTTECDFNRSDLKGVELRNKTLGIIGFGRIGRRVAQRAKPFGMKIMAYDPYISTKLEDELGVKLTTMENVLKNADIITIHVPLNKNTQHLIKWKHFKIMKKGVYFINTSRGGVVDSNALLRALEEEIVRSAGLDVIEDCLETEKSFLRNNKVLVTPHLGASTKDAQKNVSWRILEGITQVLKGFPPEYPVNFPKLGAEIKDIYTPYRKLIIKLAKLLVNFNLPFDNITINYPKALPENLRKTLTRHFLAIFLKPLVSTRISIVNSVIIARERDLGIIETVRSGKDFENLISIQISNNSKKQSEIVGKIYSDGYIEIIRINDFGVSFSPFGSIFIIKHVDKPGMIGKITTFLGDNEINIAELQVSRDKKTKTQLMVLKSDQEPDEETVDKLKEIEDIDMVFYNNLSNDS
ncbi:MAG: phosphoglycerate dehydrogenase [Candidatus Lokiarchaeota archaeon]|nr:phosphoglycerate dehydrogenase [Candidatus Lokiarchaeota archaeon]